MSYLYSAVLQYQDSDGRFANLTGTPTVTAYDLAGNSIASPSITNLATGVYKVSVTQDDLEDVIFRVVPHVDDQANFDDVAVMQDRVTQTADEILTDTGTTLPAILEAIKGAGWTDEDLVAIKAAIDAGGASGGATAQQVWEYVTRTLTQSATEIIAAVSGSSITQIRGNTWDFDITDVTLDAHKQQFYVKQSHVNADSEALLGIDSDIGLLVLNGSGEVTAGNASLTYDAVAEVLHVHVEAVDTAKLPPGKWAYGIQGIGTTGVVSENYTGDYKIITDIVRATS